MIDGNREVSIDQLFHDVQSEIDRLCPSPEPDLIRLCTVAAKLRDSRQTAHVRQFVLDADELTAQVRWHLGHALAVLRAVPELTNENVVSKEPFVSSALLLLRGFISEPDRVMYADLRELRQGATVAGWVFHMLIDGALLRAVSALDRLAGVAWLAAGLPRERIYFRSRKLQRIHAVLQQPSTASLVTLAESELFELILDYRDGLSHEVKAYSSVAGAIPGHSWSEDDGSRVFSAPSRWDADLLFALGRAAYNQLVEGLSHTAAIVEFVWPQSAEEPQR